MVYSPSMYLVASAVAAVALQMQQAAATSLWYDPTAILPTTESTNSIFSGMGVDDKICKFETHCDPTLPDISTISRTVVLYPDLLCNQSTPPTGHVFDKVGIAVIFNDAHQDTYLISGSLPNLVVPATKTDTKTPSETDKEIVKDEVTAKNCATDWDEPMTTPTVSSHAPKEEIHTERRLVEHNSRQIITLENYFGIKMETTLAKLPTEGVVSTPLWPGPYWPTYEDSINVQLYQDEYPISAKYALAFDLNVNDFMDKISKEVGIDMDRSDKKEKTECTVNEECRFLNDGSVCSIRTGHPSGFCFPTWWGICNAWASAAILEQEPNCPVTYNNVTFYPLELKGLLSYIHNAAMLPYIFTGVRFNGDDAKDVKDEYGRSKSLAFQDINPAFVHIAISNILGNFGKSFIIDVTAGNQVWNQPVRGFRVLEQTKMSLKEAAQTFYAREKYPWNAAARSIVYMQTRLTWIVETYEDGPLVSTGQVDKYTTGYDLYYLLEMDGAGKIIGGEWLFDSNDNHPDFLWFPTRKPAADLVLPNEMSYAAVRMLLEKSVTCSDSE